jgi:hypothetical protein
MNTGRIMKKMVRFVALFALSTFLASQSLVDVAKQERERREKLKGKNVKVVTNADLKSIKKTAAVSTPAAPTAESGTAEPAAGQEPAVPEGQGAEAPYDRGTGPTFASGVLEGTVFVENPEAALDPPDGRFAEVGIMGQLDVELSVRNGPGNDVAVYARLAGMEQALSAFEEEGIPMSAWPGGMISYGVLAMRDDGEWEALGRGMGESWPEGFDLGGLKETNRIRIIFKPDNNPSPPNQPFQIALQSFTMGVDAIEAVH